MSKEVSDRVKNLRALCARFRNQRDIFGRIENRCMVDAARGEWSTQLSNKTFTHTGDLAQKLISKGYSVSGSHTTSHWVVSWDDQ